jgi:hypothetical protein
VQIRNSGRLHKATIKHQQKRYYIVIIIGVVVGVALVDCRQSNAEAPPLNSEVTIKHL